jgi:hypothetical protein
MKSITVNAVALSLLAINLVACTGTATPGAAVTDPGTPGATGQRIVPGDPSTITGDRKATRVQQTDPFVPSN